VAGLVAGTTLWLEVVPMISRAQTVLRFVASAIFLAMGVSFARDRSWIVSGLALVVAVMWLVLGIRAARSAHRPPESGRQS
jgi:uncharacterized membrane protein